MFLPIFTAVYPFCEGGERENFFARVSRASVGLEREMTRV